MILLNLILVFWRNLRLSFAELLGRLLGSFHKLLQVPFNQHDTNSLVRKGGLEPPWIAPPDPKSGASANSATFACGSSIVPSTSYKLLRVSVGLPKVPHCEQFVNKMLGRLQSLLLPLQYHAHSRCYSVRIQSVSCDR